MRYTKSGQIGKKRGRPKGSKNRPKPHYDPSAPLTFCLRGLAACPPHLWLPRTGQPNLHCVRTEVASSHHWRLLLSFSLHGTQVTPVLSARRHVTKFWIRESTTHTADIPTFLHWDPVHTIV